MQADLLNAGWDQDRINEIGEPIIQIREERQKVMTASAKRKDVQNVLKIYQLFLDEHNEVLNALVVRNIIKKTVCRTNRCCTCSLTT